MTRRRPALLLLVLLVVSGLPSLTAAAAPGAAEVQRIAGTGRYDTAAAVSASFFDPGVPVAYVATGLSFPDALAGGAAAAATGGPVLLVDRVAVPAATATELERLRPGRIVVLGGRERRLRSGPRSAGGVHRRRGHPPVGHRTATPRPPPSAPRPSRRAYAPCTSRPGPASPTRWPPVPPPGRRAARSCSWPPARSRPRPPPSSVVCSPRRSRCWAGRRPSGRRSSRRCSSTPRSPACSDRTGRRPPPRWPVRPSPTRCPRSSSPPAAPSPTRWPVGRSRRSPPAR